MPTCSGKGPGKGKQKEEDLQGKDKKAGQQRKGGSGERPLAVCQSTACVETPDQFSRLWHVAAPCLACVQRVP